MTTTPRIDTEETSWRIASTAAPSPRFLVAATHPAAGGHRPGLGDSHQLQRQVAIRAHVQRGVQRSSHGGAFLEWQEWKVLSTQVTTSDGS